MNASELKYQVEAHGNEPYFFSRKTMKFFGDTMRNYGVRDGGVITTYSGEHVECWELYRKRSVAHGLQSSAYFAKDDYRQVFSGRNHANTDL
jgi:hypothetical protein